MIMTTKCNLRCKYCYADEGSYGFSDSKFIGEDVIDATINLVERRILSEKEKLLGHQIELAYVAFGGIIVKYKWNIIFIRKNRKVL
jgi:sulfatase maturation enzyme AslB (radical SAM superfamily)